MLGAGYWILDAGYWMLDAGYWILDTGYWILDTGYWISVQYFEVIFTDQSVYTYRLVSSSLYTVPFLNKTPN